MIVCKHCIQRSSIVLHNIFVSEILRATPFFQRAVVMFFCFVREGREFFPRVPNGLHDDSLRRSVWSVNALFGVDVALTFVASVSAFTTLCFQDIDLLTFGHQDPFLEVC